MMISSVDLGRLYGDGHVYSGFAHPGLGRWLPKDPNVIKSLTGGMLAILGSLPVVCAAGAADERGLDLLREAGLVLDGERLVFRDLEEYESILRDLQKQGAKLVLQHRHPAQLLPPESYWVEPDLLSSLNDKANLPNFVLPRHLPKRHVFVSSGAREWARISHDFPCVLKAGTSQSTGGGVGDVFICRDIADAVRAGSALEDSERVIVEEWLPSDRMYCLNFAVAQDAEVSYLGGAEIVCTQDGAYRGNWLGSGCEPNAASVDAGMATARVAAQLGYRGVFGIDLAEMDGSESKIFDLNFRFCGSTVGLLLLPSIQSSRGNCVGRLCSLSFKGAYSDAISMARQALRDGYFLPFSSYRTDGEEPQAFPRVNGLILGSCRKDVLSAEEFMRGNGWH